MIVRQVMTAPVVTVGLDAGVQEVRALFEVHRFHHLLVTDGGRLVGVISDRDLLKNLSPFIHSVMERQEDRNLLKRRVHQIMRRKPIVVSPETDLSAAACLMLGERVSCLPVVEDDGRPIGIVTMRDLLAAGYGLPLLSK